MASSEAPKLLTSNLALVERTIAFACRRYRLTPDDAEEFAAIVKLRLVDNDYAIVRAYEERSSFATYINIVVQRMALDYRISTWGKWHSSAEAKRLGALAIDLERLLHRDGRTLDDALVILATSHEGVTRDALEALNARLPPRAPRHRDVPLDESLQATSPVNTDEALLERERRKSSHRVSSMVSQLIAQLPPDDRLILQLRFEGGMTVAQIARMLRIEQKLLYRRIEQRMRELKRELEKNGVSSRDVHDLIGGPESHLQFDLGNPNPRPSIATDGTTAHSEGTQ